MPGKQAADLAPQLAASPSDHEQANILSKSISKECMALLKEASEMFSETGCVPGIDGEEVAAETIVPDVKGYISETIDDPEAIYDPAIWDTPGFAPTNLSVESGVMRNATRSVTLLLF